MNTTNERSLDPDVYERLVAANAAGVRASGIPWEAFTDVQEREIDAMAEAIENIASLEISELSSHPILAAIAGERVSWYLNACREAGERLIDTRNAPGYDEWDPITATRLYVLTNRTEHLVALEIPYDWKTYVRMALRAQTRCDAHVLHNCYDHQNGPATEIVACKRGEVLCAFKICDECLDALKWIQFNSREYAGPCRWQDNGDRGSRDDLSDDWEF
jgi:hypothetical protein